jgi:hypothetical protein
MPRRRNAAHRPCSKDRVLVSRGARPSGGAHLVRCRGEAQQPARGLHDQYQPAGLTVDDTNRPTARYILTHRLRSPTHARLNDGRVGYLVVRFDCGVTWERLARSRSTTAADGTETGSSAPICGQLCTAYYYLAFTAERGPSRITRSWDWIARQRRRGAESGAAATRTERVTVDAPGASARASRAAARHEPRRHRRATVSGAAHTSGTLLRRRLPRLATVVESSSGAGPAG